MLGERIAVLRIRQGWSQAELARRLHISASAIGMYEQGRREPSIEVLVMLSGVLGVSVDFLLTGRTLCGSDWRASSDLYGGKAGDRPPADILRCLSREELIVLLTASLLGNPAAK